MQAPLTEIEQKIVNFLRAVDAPNLPSQIAPFICETCDNTTAAILELERKGILYREPDISFLRATGEAASFGLRTSK
jgi:hypothetical protein